MYLPTKLQAMLLLLTIKSENLQCAKVVVREVGCHPFL